MAQWVLEIPDQFDGEHRVSYSIIEWQREGSEARIAQVLALGPIGADEYSVVTDWLDPWENERNLRFLTGVEVDALIKRERAYYATDPTKRQSREW